MIMDRNSKILTFAVAIVVIGAVFQFGPIKIPEARVTAGTENNPEFIIYINKNAR